MKKKVKNAILYTITFTALVLWILSILTLDSETLIPLFTMAISGGWLGAFMWANDMLE